MKTTASDRRIRTSVRIPEYLYDRIGRESKRLNQSRNSIMASVLLDAFYYEPNEETKQAIEEARSGIGLKEVDTSSYEAFVKSIMDEED